jgi:hypothetical protein
MSIGNRTGFRLLGGYVVQDLAQRISIPCFSVNGRGERVSDAIAFSVHKKSRLTKKDNNEPLFDSQNPRSAMWQGDSEDIL